MSYIRSSSTFTRVKGASDGEYVFPAASPDGEYVEDYDKNLRPKALVEVLYRKLARDDEWFAEWAARQLANKFDNVELREEPVSQLQNFNKFEEFYGEYDPDKESDSALS